MNTVWFWFSVAEDLKRLLWLRQFSSMYLYSHTSVKKNLPYLPCKVPLGIQEHCNRFVLERCFKISRYFTSCRKLQNHKNVVIQKKAIRHYKACSSYYIMSKSYSIYWSRIFISLPKARASSLYHQYASVLLTSFRSHSL